eukprot:1618474-Prymnesium_polylepis.1
MCIRDRDGDGGDGLLGPAVDALRERAADRVGEHQLEDFIGLVTAVVDDGHLRITWGRGVTWGSYVVAWLVSSTRGMGVAMGMGITWRTFRG